MKHKRKIIGALTFCAAVFLVGCGEQSVSEMSSSSVESSIASVETSSSSSESSSSSTVESSVDMGDGSTEDIAVIVTDNQDILTSNQSSQGDSSTSDTSTDVSTSDSTSTSDTSTPTTSKPTISSSSSGGNTTTPISPYWNPNAPGNTPGPYGGYYDASGKLHAKADSVPLDSYGYPVESFYTEFGTYRATKAEKEKWDEDTKRIDEGSYHPNIGLDWDDLP